MRISAAGGTAADRRSVSPEDGYPIEVSADSSSLMRPTTRYQDTQELGSVERWIRPHERGPVIS